MKSFVLSVSGLAISLSFFAGAHAASNSTTGPSCGVANVDDSYFSVVGVQGTGVHPRQELRELEKDAELWNMFLQAFARFQAADQDAKLSYYQVAGIHGVPFGKWDNATGLKGQEMMGYCPHVSNMFGSWHRPYLALFEQVLHDRAVEIAKEYAVGEARDKAMLIADKIRLPYWDWAVDPPNKEEGSMPSCLRRPMATVTFPNGTTSDIANPLYRYDFHPLKYDDFAPLSEFEYKDWNYTRRNPLDGFAANATSRNRESAKRINAQQPNNRDILYKLLTTYQPFNQVSNKANGGTIGNFETLHDGVHNAFGLGHMGIVEVSAFDPIFWFHHCNMDRIVALYQYRYPDTWVEDAEQVKGTFATLKGSIQGPASPLAPFHMNALGDMWTSTTSRNWTSFGYTYPELMTHPTNETFTSTLNTLYKPSVQGLNSTNTTLLLPGNNENTTTSNTTAEATAWLCEVTMPTDIQISYSVRAFLGAPSADPKNWPTDDTYIGQLASMSSPRMASDILVTGTIALSEKLAQKHASGELKSLDKEHVQAYLKAHFTWRIQALDFSEIPRHSPPRGLNVTVFNVPVSVPERDTEVPVWHGEVEYHADIGGNPPVYGGMGGGGGNLTTPAAGAAGRWNASSGAFEWRNGTEGMAKGEETTAVVTPWPSAQTGAVASSVASGSPVGRGNQTTSGTVIVSPSASSTLRTSLGSAVSAVAPLPTTHDVRTRVVTSVVMEYVTLS
ncbi:Di-copper centre-containing protein [Dothidotthia symphoricarpi CBS 119687]|uniref:tyrosinase n=1 Tax=Dothidotthia symphoricarpi CBS 119687 TaxID=1392245 RepID=A0A6A6AEL2_9PLEO|nr:Di-copper centre-containing protein [Dothidotthia symphoricarpi CBS 119687]KAF2130392.1 Di-copper centre-containing protein [Dothidotthia symphoricarpi CBS 119687]